MSPSVFFRLAATENDLIAIVQMLVDDSLGAWREQSNSSGGLSPSYHEAFETIKADPNQELIVGELDGEIVATCQLSFIQYLTYCGGMRAQIEAVRVKANHRAAGIGRKMFDYAIARARQRGCPMIQLTTDKRRPDALRFYESMGFAATHQGMKLFLDPVDANQT